ncbi:MAG: RNA polymerase sigma factor [Polyangiaceae bacterium]|jgi:RNA polymerase sigma factor (sigma-70 family)|nr:RNA polymerase sigma factor [Polyangiaceae bacterium]
MDDPIKVLDDPMAALAAQALRGDTRATESLCRELQGPLYRLAVRLLQDVEDAREATQEALILVLTHLSMFRGDSRLLTWAYRITLRHVLHTRRDRERSRSRLALEWKIRAGLLLTAGELAEVERAAEHRETSLGCTRAMLHCLSMDERATIILAEILGADDELGAQLCGVPEVTYRKRLSRARAKLRPILEGLCGLVDEMNPCSCERQRRAKALVGQKKRALPLVREGEVVAVAERLGEVRRLGAVLAGPGVIMPPEELWKQVKARLAPVLGA